MKLPVVEFGISNQATIILDTWKKTQFLAPLEGVSPSLPYNLYINNTPLNLETSSTRPPPFSLIFIFFLLLFRFFPLRNMWTVG